MRRGGDMSVVGKITGCSARLGRRTDDSRVALRATRTLAEVVLKVLARRVNVLLEHVARYHVSCVVGAARTCAHLGDAAAGRPSVNEDITSGTIIARKGWERST